MTPPSTNRSRLFLLALMPQIGGILLMVGQSAKSGYGSFERLPLALSRLHHPSILGDFV
jgi:hypothetical protein